MSRTPPILHVSLAVRDLDPARDFYVNGLGCELGRVRDDWVDVWFHGLQLTLHEDPDQVVPPGDRAVRHFGVTLQTDYAGTPQEQTKAMVADPSGNAIELKSYADPAAAFAS